MIWSRKFIRLSVLSHLRQKSKGELKDGHSIYWAIIHCFISRSRIFHLKFSLWLALQAFEQRGIFIVPHLLWQGESVFSRSYWMNHPVQSPLTTHKGKWRIYFNQDPQGFPAILWDTLHWINPDLYKNVFTVLVILISLPVTTVKAERSFSVMMRIKSYRSEIRNDHRASDGAN
jgi:hypothetical protein